VTLNTKVGGCTPYRVSKPSLTFPSATFADGRLTEQLKTMASGDHTDQRVKKRIISVLASWHQQFKDDPSMRHVSSLYQSVQASVAGQRKLSNELRQFGITGVPALGAEEARERRERGRKQKGKEEKEAKKAKEREEVERKAREKAVARDPQKRSNKQRKPFNFEIEKPNILSSIATASQASNNLINALKLVNREKESIEENPRVQETLNITKVARKAVVRYIQVRLDNQCSDLKTDFPDSWWRTKKSSEHSLTPMSESSLH
jgi:hypothetical protein